MNMIARHVYVLCGCCFSGEEKESREKIFHRIKRLDIFSVEREGKKRNYKYSSSRQITDRTKN
jgi:hypothetical protein